MEHQSPAEEPQSDLERVEFVENIIADVESGRIKEMQQVKEALKPLGSHCGPFGCSSFELEMAVGKLKIACHKKGLK